MVPRQDPGAGSSRVVPAPPLVRGPWRGPRSRPFPLPHRPLPRAVGWSSPSPSPSPRGRPNPAGFFPSPRLRHSLGSNAVPQHSPSPSPLRRAARPRGEAAASAPLSALRRGLPAAPSRVPARQGSLRSTPALGLCRAPSRSAGSGCSAVPSTGLPCSPVPAPRMLGSETLIAPKLPPTLVLLSLHPPQCV